MCSLEIYSINTYWKGCTFLLATVRAKYTRLTPKSRDQLHPCDMLHLAIVLDCLQSATALGVMYRTEAMGTRIYRLQVHMDQRLEIVTVTRWDSNRIVIILHPGCGRQKVELCAKPICYGSFQLIPCLILCIVWYKYQLTYHFAYFEVWATPLLAKHSTLCWNSRCLISNVNSTVHSHKQKNLVVMHHA